jgi:outer membrane protein TolC
MRWPSTRALSGGHRRITLEEAQQQAAQAASPMARLGELSVEAARQHRLGAEADYFPHLSSSLANVHFNKFMGQQVPIVHAGGTITTAAVPLVGKDQTVIAVTAAQPITTLLKIREVVSLARADENIARGKAGMPVAEISSLVEKNYFDLLLAQRQLTLVQLDLKKLTESRMVASSAPVAPTVDEAETLDANKAVIEASSKVKQLTASLNDLMGWPTSTELELLLPSPLVENMSMSEATHAATVASPEVIEAEQNVAKARAGTKLSKLDYVPDVAVLGGYVYQANALPLLPRDFSFIGVIASWNIFDFGKREHTIKERSTQLEMAQTALQLTKAKAAAAVKSSYFELEGTRQLSEMAQRMESAAHTMNAKYSPDDLDIEASQAKLELEALLADLEHRKAYAKLKAQMGQR